MSQAGCGALHKGKATTLALLVSDAGKRHKRRERLAPVSLLPSTSLAVLALVFSTLHASLQLQQHVRAAGALAPAAAAAVPVRLAATTLIWRDGRAGAEVLMVRRSLKSSFMPGAYVFPGGAVDATDAAPETLALCDEEPAAMTARLGAPLGAAHAGEAAAYAVAALRECFEECGLWLGDEGRRSPAELGALRASLLRPVNAPFTPSAAAAGLRLHTSVLQPWAHWTTPLGLHKRFKTMFLVAPAPAGQTPSVDAGETTTLAWVDPASALAEAASGTFHMEFATLRIMESFEPLARQGTAAVLAHAAAQESVPVVTPRLKLAGDGSRAIAGILMPGDAGFEEAAAHF